MASVTLPELRGLARLYRDGVDGVGQQLADIIEHSSESLPDIIGFPRKNLDRLRRSDDPVGVLVSTIEGASRLARDARNRVHRDGARELAVAVAQNAQWRSDGTIALPLVLVAQMLALWPGSGVLVFGDRGCVDVRRLRAVLRECRGLTSTAVVVTEQAVVVSYTTNISRGLVRLFLGPVSQHSEALVVPLEPNSVVSSPPAPTAHHDVAASTDAAAEIVPAHEEALEPAAVTVAIAPTPAGMPGSVASPPSRPRPPRATTSPWASRFFEAFAAVIGGAP